MVQALSSLGNSRCGAIRVVRARSSPLTTGQYGSGWSSAPASRRRPAQPPPHAGRHAQGSQAGGSERATTNGSVRVTSLPIETVQAIVAAGAGVCHEAGIPVAGGHSIDNPEPIYGLVALGLADPDRLLRNVGARPGDRLILTKALGIGILSAALKHGTLEPELYQAMVGSATALNVLGADMPAIEGVHAMTDVTGFGLLGHALEMTRPDGLSLRIALGDLPRLHGVVGLISSGVRTGASGRNWSSFGREATLSAELPAWASDLLCDPQTSGGLLIAAAPDAVPLVLEKAAARGIAAAAVIGTFEAGSGILVA